jgi:DNA-binding PadR family transcriptional regulator
MAPHGLGDLEQLVLLAVLRLGELAYAVSVREEIQQRTGRDVSRGAVYVTLDRMERKGYLRSRLGEPTRERGGKAKRLYTVAAPGMRAIRAALSDTRSMLDGLPPDLAWTPRT